MFNTNHIDKGYFLRHERPWRIVFFTALALSLTYMTWDDPNTPYMTRVMLAIIDVMIVYVVAKALIWRESLRFDHEGITITNRNFFLPGKEVEFIAWSDVQSCKTGIDSNGYIRFKVFTRDDKGHSIDIDLLHSPKFYRQLVNHYSGRDIYDEGAMNQWTLNWAIWLGIGFILLIAALLYLSE